MTQRTDHDGVPVEMNALSKIDRLKQPDPQISIWETIVANQPAFREFVDTVTLWATTPSISPEKLTNLASPTQMAKLKTRFQGHDFSLQPSAAASEKLLLALKDGAKITDSLLLAAQDPKQLDHLLTLLIPKISTQHEGKDILLVPFLPPELPPARPKGDMFPAMKTGAELIPPGVITSHPIPILVVTKG